MTKFVLIIKLEIAQIPHNLFGPSTQIGQLFGIFLKKALHMSMVHFINILFFCLNKNNQSNKRVERPKIELNVLIIFVHKLKTKNMVSDFKSPPPPFITFFGRVSNSKNPSLEIPCSAPGILGQVG